MLVRSVCAYIPDIRLALGFCVVVVVVSRWCLHQRYKFYSISSSLKCHSSVMNPDVSRNKSESSTSCFIDYALNGQKSGSLELEEVMKEIQDTFPPDSQPQRGKLTWGQNMIHGAGVG